MNASLPAIPSAPDSWPRAISSSSSRLPWASVRPKLSSSESSHLATESRCSCSSGYSEAHQLGDALGVAPQEAGLELERAAALENRAAHDPAQHVAAVLVGGHDAVGDQEGHRAGVVGEDPQRSVGGELLSVAAAGKLLAERDQRRELVGLEHRLLVLEDRGEAVEPEAGVDVLGRKRGQDPSGSGRTA